MEYERKFILLKQFESIFFQKTKGCQLVLRSFLNAILSKSLRGSIKEIASVQSQRCYFASDQQSSWLIDALLDKRSHVTIRIQVHDHDYFQKQSSKFAINQRLGQISSTTQAERFMIHILNFNLLLESDHYHHRFQSTTPTYTSHRETQQIHYIELPKFTTERPQTTLEKWLYFICHLNDKQHPQRFIELVKQDPYFKLASHLSKRKINPPILIKEEPLNLIEWQYYGEQQEKERIALRMMRSDIPYEKIIEFTDLTLADLDELALTIPMLDS
ncbi:MAG TPA: hypothetical protein GXZ58_01205 [Bacilli bacterium]|nr:hypothetical protein [Bacilli bacterium]